MDLEDIVPTIEGVAVYDNELSDEYGKRIYILYPKDRSMPVKLMTEKNVQEAYKKWQEEER